MLYQQGDVLMTKVDAVPEGATKLAAKSGKCVLAEGEATGHAHTVTAGEGAALMEVEGVKYLVVKKSATVRHQEHKPIRIEAGTYRIGIVREWDHFAEESRGVRD